MEKYLFKVPEKAKVLQGRTIKYLAENKINISQEYLTNILNGKVTCSGITASKIAFSICHNAKREDYFDIVKGGEDNER